MHQQLNINYLPPSTSFNQEYSFDHSWLNPEIRWASLFCVPVVGAAVGGGPGGDREGSNLCFLTIQDSKLCLRLLAIMRVKST
jgi:hypothetical protein